NGISANGSVIYGWAEPNWTRTAAIWYNDEMILIDETQYGEAWGASPSGNYVTGGIGADGFIWSPTEGVTLFQNTLSSGAISPTSVLDDGTVFGYTSEGWPPTPDTRRAFVRHPAGAMETFNEYVASRGWFDASDWIFFSVNDVTPDGNQFVGAAELPNGDWISFFLDLEPGTPIIEVNPLVITETLISEETSTQTISIENVGDGYLLYNALVQYTAADPKVKQVPVGENFKSGEISLGKRKMLENDENAAPKSAKGTTLNYDGNNIDAIGLIAGGTFYGASRFLSEITSVFEGYQLESVDVYVGDLPTAIKLMIWDAGTTTSAGTLLYEQAFTPDQASWNTVTLESPVEITGSDIWIGFEITHIAGVYVLGIDGGPADPNGGWLSIDAEEWERINDYGLNSNWNIRANLSFNGLNWLSLSPASGILEEEQSEGMVLSFDAAGLEVGSYTANIRISSNDAENSLIIIPVTLVVEQEVNIADNMQIFSINVFPNPASNIVNIISEYEIEQITIVNMLGQKVYSSNVNNQRAVFDVSGYKDGMYFIHVLTQQGIYSKGLQVVK
ncbi:MAG: T9SS C-terminal target domain-containing protein, partial [Bacteroidetes bacterium]